MPNDTTHLFAVLRGPEVRILPLSQALQTDVAAIFRQQADAFLTSDMDVLDFDPSLRPDEDHIIRIPNYELPPHIREALENPLSASPLVFEPGTTARIVGLFTGHLVTPMQVRLQVFDRRQVLTQRGVSIILSGGTFKRLEEPGLALDTALSALVVEHDLYLRSYSRAKRVLDLTEYYREATDGEVEDFSEHARLCCDDTDGLKVAADSWVRRKVAILLEGGDLDNLAPRKAKRIAAPFGVTIAVKKVDGTERIVLPTTRKELKALLRFLATERDSSMDSAGERPTWRRGVLRGEKIRGWFRSATSRHNRSTAT